MSLLAISTAGAILIGVASGLAVLVAGLATMAALRRPRRRRREVDIPRGMQPGPSDADLEKPILETLQVWGLAMVVLLALWLPVVWLQEPQTNADDLRAAQATSVERGHLITLPGGEENPLGFNCERCHGPGLRGGLNVFNETIVQVPDLTNVCGGGAFGHPLIEGLQDVVDVIAEGRPGTDMPSWSVRFAGAMNDQQITDVVNYILSIQEVPDDQNICVNPAAAAEASPSPGAEDGASPTPAESPAP